MNLDPEDLKREIDEALAEIEQLEAEVIELFAQLGGENAVKQIEAYKRAQQNQPRVAPLVKPGALPGSSSSPPATP